MPVASSETVMSLMAVVKVTAHKNGTDPPALLKDKSRKWLYETAMIKLAQFFAGLNP